MISMYPEKKFKKPKDHFMLLATIAILVVGFVFLVALVLVFSSSSSSLTGKCVAVVNLNQEITVESTPPSLFFEGMPGSEEIAKKIEDINKRDDVGAVVLVVNSPGGSVVATREIYDSYKTLEKPKVAYFREVAASGAYYIASGSDYIISDPDAITGSIGVIATFSDLSGLFDKIGMNTTAVKSGLHKDIGSSSRPMTDEELGIIQALIDEVFDEFKTVVVENRKGTLNMVKFEEITDGRILSGRQAKSVGLVDALGNKKDAIKKAAELAGITEEEPRICDISLVEQEKGLFDLGALFPPLKNSKMQIKFQ